MDRISKQKRSETMSRIKSKDSKIETLFRKELWKNGFRYSANSNKYFGKPDILLKKYKTVVFIDSCFWHGCKKHCRIPASRKSFWLKKIKRNITRDKVVSRYYKKNDWRIFRVWEHELIGKRSEIIKILKKLRSRKDLDGKAVSF
jgi:DNA mismatch endonuclease (patch repair protein)